MINYAEYWLKKQTTLLNRATKPTKRLESPTVAIKRKQVVKT